MISPHPPKTPLTAGLAVAILLLIAPPARAQIDVTSIEEDHAWEELGTSVSSAGDVNGDGYDDVLTGGPYYQPRAFGPYVGRAYLYLGSASGVSTNWAWYAEGVQPDQRFGLLVSAAGDVDGDGYDDVLVGSPFFDGGGGVNAGQAYLYEGSSGGLGSSPTWSIRGDRAGALFGAVSEAGDVNGDGYDDVVVGAPNFDSDTENDCRVMLYLGGPGGLSETPARTLSHDPATGFGFSLSGAGDVNGDGYDDVVVGAYSDDAPEVDEGRVFLYLGSSSGLSTSPDWSADGGQAGALFGVSVAGAGDVNRDGYDDVVIGAPNYDGGDENEGQVAVFLGNEDGLAATPWWTAEGDQAEAWFGTSVSGAGDVNGDGYDDFIAGGYQFDADGGDEGEVIIYLGADDAPWTTTGRIFEGSQPGANLGTSVAGAGDVDGNGVSDAVAGAPFYESEEMDLSEGRVLVYAFCADVDGDDLCDPPDADWDDDGWNDSADCAPTDPDSHPGATEVPDDGIDQDCSGADAVTCSVDGDGDGYGGGDTVVAADGDCIDAGEAREATDCNDDDGSIYPGAPDPGGDGIDQDCSGADAAGDALDAAPDTSGAADAGSDASATDATLDPSPDATGLDTLAGGAEADVDAAAVSDSARPDSGPARGRAGADLDDAATLSEASTTDCGCRSGEPPLDPRIACPLLLALWLAARRRRGESIL